MSVVLITAVVLSLVGAAYFWGLPLVNKRSSVTSFTVAERFVKDLDRAIISLAEAGSGQTTVDIPDGFVTVIPETANRADNNSILLQYESPQPLALNSSTVYLGGGSFLDTSREVGVFGEGLPGIITLSSQGFANSYTNTIRLHYRELDTQITPLRGYKLVLAGTKLSGSDRVRVRYDTTETVLGGAANTGDLVKTTLTLDVV